MRIKYNIDWLIRKTVQKNDPNRIVDNIFDYQNVIRKRPDLDREIYGSNYCYGMSYILKRYSGYKKRIRCLIEHAPGLTNIGLTEYKSNIFDTLLVSSVQRKEFLSEYTDKKIFDIGPSIAYANKIYDDFNISTIKKSFGKTLLLYPSHNVIDSDWEKDTEKFIAEAKKIVDEYHFDTVLVCMFYIDIQRGTHLIYEKEGWNIVSAGQMVNYDFNDCMKTIISLADMAMFQTYSSAVGYCIYLNVPVFIFPFNYNDPGIRKKYATDVLKEIYGLFKDFSEEISDKQKELCSYYFGYDSVKKSEELLGLFKSFEKNKLGKD